MKAMYSLSDASNHLRLLALELYRIPLVTLFPAVLQPFALVVFEHAVLAAEVSVAEIAVADDALR